MIFCDNDTQFTWTRKIGNSDKEAETGPAGSHFNLYFQF